MPRTRVRAVHVVGGLVAVLILLVGVVSTVRLVSQSSGGGGSGHSTPTPTPSPTVTPTGTPSPTASGAGPTPSKSAPGPRRVTLAGVTLNNLFPQHAGDLTQGTVRCLNLENRGYRVVVRVERIDIVTDQGPRPLALGAGSCGDPPCLHADMRPLDNECDVVVKVPDVVGSYRGRLLLRLSTVCTDTKHPPCTLIGQHVPSAKSPVYVTWSGTIQRIKAQVAGPDPDPEPSATAPTPTGATASGPR